MKTNVALRSLKILVLAGICALCIIPFYSLLVLSLNAPNRIFYEGNLFVPSFHFQNYADAWHKSKIGTAMLNSALITFGTLGLTILLGGMAGYAIARRRSVLNRLTFALLIGCMMIPGIINTVPLYSLMRRIQAVDTLWGMVLVCSTLALPSAVFIYTSFVRSLPRELDEAAVVDGCNEFEAFWRVIFPVLRPATASFVTLNGFGVWNNYAQAVFFLQSRAKQNIPQALSVFFQQFAGAKWHLVSATAAIAIVPVVAIFLVFQKQFIKGLTEGAVKG